MSLLRAALVLVALGACPDAASAASYRLGFGDKLRITIYQWDVLSSSYTVDAAGRVSMPIIGDVPVAGIDTRQAGNLIADHLREKLNLADAPIASVEVVQFRPFYILGDVAKPGDYPFRPGMVVLDAVAIAGGLERPSKSQTYDLSRDAISAQGEIAIQTAHLNRMLLQRARLQAELDGASAVAMPGDLVETGDHSIVVDLLSQENLIMASRRKLLESQLGACEQTIQLVTQQIATRRAQVDAIKDELVGLNTELENVKSLVQKGVATVSRQSSLDIIVADLKRTQFEIETTMLRGQQDIADASHKKAELTLDFRKSVLADFSAANGNIDETRKRIRAARQQYENSTTITQVDEVSVTIVRRSDDGPASERVAADLDEVQPGDVLKVQRRRLGG